MNPVRLTQRRSLCTILANQTHNGVSNLIIEVSPKSMVVVRSSDIFAHDLQTAHGLCSRKKRCSESSGAVISQRPPLVNALSAAGNQMVAARSVVDSRAKPVDGNGQETMTLVWLFVMAATAMGG